MLEDHKKVHKLLIQNDNDSIISENNICVDVTNPITNFNQNDLVIDNNNDNAFAEKAIAACPKETLYGRVDIFYDNNNALSIGELELIEPELWFRNYPTAAKLLADAIFNKFNFIK